MAGFFVKYRTADNEQPLGHEPQTNRHLTSVHKWDPIRTDDRSGMKGRRAIPENLRKFAKTPKYLGFQRFSFGSICLEKHRNTLVYDQNVVKNVVSSLR